MDDYIRANWLLVKLHGSVNWGRKVRRPAQRRSSLSLDPLANIAIPSTVSPDSLAESPSAEFLANRFPNVRNLLDKTVSQREGYRDHSRRDGEDFYYPAMTIPVEGKSGFSGPPDHIQALQEFLPTCQNVLIIGVSGKDDDLLALLKEHLPQCDTVSLVADTESATRDVARRFGEVPHLAGAAKGGM